MGTLISILHEKDFMKALVLSTLLFLIGCSNQNANLFDPGQTSGTFPANSCVATCKHVDGLNYDVSTLTIEAGACQFSACLDPNFAENSKATEYQAYIDAHGGTLVHDASKCYTTKTYGTGCPYQGALNYTAASQTPGTCDFRACTDPDYMEYWQYLGMQAYEAAYPGGTITSDPSLCLTKFSGCKSTSQYVTNFESGVLFDDGSCNFDACTQKGYQYYDVAEETAINSYKSSLGNCRPFTGTVTQNCGGLLGCAFQHASNYNTNAEVENGTCNISCCSTVGYENFDANCQANIAAYQSLLTSLGVTLTGTLDSAADCGKALGCYFQNQHVSNYNAQAKEDGSCDIRCCGDQTAINYDQSCQQAINTYQQTLAGLGVTHTGVYDTYAGCQYPTPGCAYQHAYVTNWQPHKVEDGSCDIQCCGTQGYENYDPNCQVVVNQYTQAAGGSTSGNINTNYQCGKKLGCYFQNQFVSNYDQNSIENGSCNIQCCAQQGYANYDPLCAQAVSQYQSLLQSLGLTQSGAINTSYNCGPQLGCNYNDSLGTGYVLNYNQGAQEDGSCNIQCCADPNAQYYDPKCQQVINGYTHTPKIGNINDRFGCGQTLGCSYNASGVQNYAAGTSENGSCNIACCSTPGFENYSAACASTVNGYSQLLASLNMAPSGVIDQDYNCGRKKGCTNSYASNYDATAQLEDGSCNIACRVCPAGYSLSTDQACVTAQNQYTQYIASLGLTSTGSISTTSSCGSVQGCAYNDTRVTNYNSQAQENGSCNISCCASPGYQNYDPNCQSAIDSYSASLAALGLTGSGILNNNYLCGGYAGCTYASQYTTVTPGATVEDGSCSINCCADSSKSNYDPNCQGAINAYTSLINGLTPTGTISNSANCGIDVGCSYNNSYASNYEANTQENGSCNIACCALQGYENYDPNCATAISGYQSFLASLGLSSNGSVNSSYNCGAQLGCSQPNLVGSNGQPGNASYVEDGSCNVQCCSNPNSANYDPNCQAKINSYSQLLAGLSITPTGQIDSAFNCGAPLGCSDNRPGVYVSNFLYGAQENGSCNIQCCGTAGYEFYNQNCQAYISNYQQLLASAGLSATGLLDSNYNCGRKIGCTDQYAMNYDPSAQHDPNNSCIFKACLTPGYENYASDQPIRDAYAAYGSPVGQLYAGPCGNKICPAGFIPVGNTCQCPTGQVLCHGQCLNSCPAGYIEQNGTCVCAPGTYQNSSGYCE